MVVNEGGQGPGPSFHGQPHKRKPKVREEPKKRKSLANYCAIKKHYLISEVIRLVNGISRRLLRYRHRHFWKRMKRKENLESSDLKQLNKSKKKSPDFSS